MNRLYDDISKKAHLLGGVKLVNKIQVFEEAQADIPMEESEALRYRGIGRKSIPDLIKLGVVTGDWHVGLSVRATSCLVNRGIKSRSIAADEILSGRFRPGKTRNLGWKSFEEICAWAGLPNPRRRRKISDIACPNCGHQIIVTVAKGKGVMP